jgi:hypothetical protein
MASSTPKPFNWRECLELAEQILAAPPARDYIHRPVFLPTVVFRVVLPAELCLEANKTMRRGFAKAKFAHASNAKKLWKKLDDLAKPWLKYRPYWPIQLESGRPQVLAVKFSSHPNDEGSNPAKKAIDMLTVPRVDPETGIRQKHRLGLIVDDRRSSVDQHHWWEFLPKKHRAFVLIEVRI